MHEVTFKVSAVKQGRGKICIVPVRLKHTTWTDREIEVYAMLDECSEGTFMSQSVSDMLEDEIKRRERLIIETINYKGESEVDAVKGLKVRGSEEFGEYYTLKEVKLPETYSRERIPKTFH